MSKALQDGTVCVLLYCDLGTVAVVSVFASIQDANTECLRLAAEAGISLEHPSPTSGPDRSHMVPVEPLRWDTAEGVSCWVERHILQAERVLSPPRQKLDTLFKRKKTMHAAPTQEQQLGENGEPWNSNLGGDIVVDSKHSPGVDEVISS